jgi:quinol monooxygenase YgiN
MADLQVVGILRASPGAEHVVRDALTQLVDPTRAEEGCISYDLYASEVAFGTYLTIETWRSRRDLDAHMQSAHVQHALGLAGEHLESAPDIHPLSAVTSPGLPHPNDAVDDDVQEEQTPSRSSG